MPDSRADQNIDVLVSVIKSLQEHIEHDGATIAASEVRTRAALIDPLLNALGWDTADPAMVIPDYPAEDGAADYALIKALPEDDSPVIAFITTKRLNEPLQGHRIQMLISTEPEGVQYACLTNGDSWELYDISKEATLDEIRILDVSLRRESAITCAMKFLPLRWPNLETDMALIPQNAQGLLVRALRANAAPSVIRRLLDHGASAGAPNDRGATPLHEAAQFSEDPRVIEILLDRGADLTATTGYGWTPLHAAARSASAPLVELMLARGASIEARDAESWTPLHHAALSGIPEVVWLLLNAGSDLEALTGKYLNGKPNQTPLHLAVRNNRNPAVAKLLLDSGADDQVKETTLLHLGVLNPNPGVAALLLDRGMNIEARSELLANFPDPDFLGRDWENSSTVGWTPLHQAVAYQNIGPRVAELLLDRGADIEARGYNGKTPLHDAILGLHQHNFLVRLLLDRGADVHAVNEDGKTSLHLAARFSAGHELAELLLDRGADIEAVDSSGATPLHAAASNIRDVRTIELLLDRGADIQAINVSGMTPLHAAASDSRNLGAVELLLDRGADIHAADIEGATPLHAAVVAMNVSAVELLLAQGANINVKDKWYKTPLHCAAKTENTETIRLLLAHDAHRSLLTSRDNDWGQTAYQIAQTNRASEEILDLLRE